MTAVAVLDRLAGVRPGSRGWSARCPAHDDASPSLSIAEGRDDRVLLHCFAGCEVRDVLDALDLQFADLMPESARSMRSKPRMSLSAPVSRPPARNRTPAINVILTALSVAGIDWRISDRGSVSRGMTTEINGTAVPSGPDSWLWWVARCPYCDAPNLWIFAPLGHAPRFSCADGCSRGEILAALEADADLANRRPA